MVLVSSVGNANSCAVTSKGSHDPFSKLTHFLLVAQRLFERRHTVRSFLLPYFTEQQADNGEETPR